MQKMRVMIGQDGHATVSPSITKMWGMVTG